MKFYGNVTINYGTYEPTKKTTAEKNEQKDKKKNDNKTPNKESRRYKRRGEYLDRRREQEAAAEQTRKARLEQCRQEALRRSDDQRKRDHLHNRRQAPKKTPVIHESRGRRRERDVVSGPAARKMKEMRRHRSRSR